jgi:putative oxidoreductase
LPGEVLPLVILLEVVGSIFLAVGFLTRLTSLALAVFSLAAIFTLGGAPAVDNYLFLAEVAVVGAFLVFMAVGAGGWSIDALIGRARSPESTRS